jgi:NtrC-family two-component system sensor histidine kinase KinB
MTSILGSADETRIDAVIECLEVGVILLDLDGVVTQVNELATLILGIERKDALRHLFDNLETRPPHYLKIRSALRRLSTYPQAERREEVSLHVRGRDHVYVLKAVPFRSDDHRCLGTIITLHDVSHLRDKDRARSNLVATLSHEIKSPLTSVSLAVELIERDFAPLSQRQQELVTAVLEDLARIRELSDSLLNLARGETGSIAVRNVRFDMARLVTAVREKFIVPAKQKDVLLKFQIEPQVESQGDPMKLLWVCASLVANALRSCPPHGRVEVSVKNLGQRIRLSVSDDGPGLSDAIRDQVFERLGQSTTDGFDLGYTELGIAIAKDIVEAHGGRIFVDSSSAGSTFSMELPTVRSM